MQNFINLCSIFAAHLVASILCVSSTFDTDCVPAHTNNDKSCRARITCYENWVEGNTDKLNYQWTRTFFIRAGFDSVIHFKKNPSFYEIDPEWDSFNEESRNLTFWLDEHNRLSLAMGNLVISRKLDLHRDYDIVERRIVCVQSTDFARLGFVEIDFQHHDYFQFGSTYKHRQFLTVSCLSID